MASRRPDELLAEPEPRVHRWSGRVRPAFGAIALSLAAITILAEWIPILSGGLWLDETFTWWQASRGWRHALSLVSFPGATPLFAALSSLFYFGPGRYMELWLRLPTFLAMLAAAYLVFRLARAWFGREAGWLALVMFVSEKDIINRATEARPYGLALAACLGIMYGLHIWLSRKRAWGWLLFVVSTILLPYWHLLFCAFLITPAVYLSWLLRRQRVPWLQLAAAAVLVGAAWLPLRVQVAALLAGGNTLSFAPVPTLDTLADVLLPKSFVIAGFVALAAAQIFFDDGLDTPPRASSGLASVAALWMFCGPVALFAASRWKHYGMLVERYVLYSVAGMILYAARFFARLRSDGARVAVMCSFTLLSLASAASHHFQGPSMGSWREPLAEISRIDPRHQAPVLVASGFVESNASDWEHATGPDTHLYAPLLLYPIANPWYPLPYRLDDRVKSYTEQLLDGSLRGRAQIILMAYEPSGLTEWLTWKLEERHYRVTSRSPDSIVLLVFEARPD